MPLLTRLYQKLQTIRKMDKKQTKKNKSLTFIILINKISLEMTE